MQIQRQIALPGLSEQRRGDVVGTDGAGQGVQLQGGRAGAGTEAIDRTQADAAVGAAAVVVQLQAVAQLRGELFGAAALAGFSPAQAQDMSSGGRGAEVVVETDHAANLGLALVEGVGNLWNGGIGDIADALLNFMKDRQQGAGGAFVALQQAVDHRQVQHLIRHTAFLTVTDKPGGCRLSESVGCGIHTTSRYRGMPVGQAP